MVRRCVAYGCSNTASETVTLHSFPKNSKYRAIWRQRVERHRKNWRPSNWSLLCSEHFEKTEENFYAEDLNRIKFQLPRRQKIQLKPEAVPTIFPAVSKPCTSRASASAPRPAARKREHQRVLEEIGISSVEETRLQTSSFEEERTSTSENSYQCSPSVNCYQLQTSCHQSVQVNISTRVKLQNARVQTCPQVSTVGMQTSFIETKSVGIQCSLAFPFMSSPYSTDNDDNMSWSSFEEPNTNLNSSYCSLENYDCVQAALSEPVKECKPAEQRKYLVFEESLKDLFSVCAACKEKSSSDFKEIGSLLIVNQTCQCCGYAKNWNSQPYLGRTPAGNVLLSACILFAGALPSKVLRVLEFLNCASISLSTYFVHQRKYLFPSIKRVWSKEESQHLEMLKASGGDVVGGVDGRCDSPGHSAKYCSSSLLDMNNNKILHIELIQSNEVSSSNNMELEGLIRTLKWLDDNTIRLASLVTDRHIQIRSYMKKIRPEIIHLFDVWHITKGIKKKLHSLSCQKEMAVVGRWCKSIINHAYYCASIIDSPTTPEMNEMNQKIIEGKWKSLMLHIANEHDGRHDVPPCTHSLLEGREAQKEWIYSGTLAHSKLESILLNKRLLQDIMMMSPCYQTSNLEAFHSLVNHYAPKTFHFSYHGMECRLLLAALHYNYNSGREKRVSSAGGYQYSLHFPKFKKGEHTVRGIPLKASFDYVSEILSCTEEIVLSEIIVEQLEAPPPPISSTFVHPEKEVAVSQHHRRFKKQQNLMGG